MVTKEKTKQDIISKGITEQIKYIQLSNMDAGWHANQMLSYLASQGVVIKANIPAVTHPDLPSIHTWEPLI